MHCQIHFQNLCSLAEEGSCNRRPDQRNAFYQHEPWLRMVLSPRLQSIILSMLEKIVYCELRMSIHVNWANLSSSSISLQELSQYQ